MADNLWIRETYVNRTEGYIVGQTDPYESFTDDIGTLFQNLQKEHGRCDSKQYTEYKDGSSVQSGWVFQRKEKYTDCDDTYIKETWVTVWKVPPTHIPEHWEGGEYVF